jgi:hypothetical protein
MPDTDISDLDLYLALLPDTDIPHTHPHLYLTLLTDPRQVTKAPRRARVFVCGGRVEARQAVMKVHQEMLEILVTFLYFIVFFTKK